MVNRKKRLQKGIESLGNEIAFHQEKLKKAIENENTELATYYEKEIGKLKDYQRKKKEILEK